MSHLPSTPLGYPRIGPRRELKRALESHWAGKISAAELAASASELRTALYERLAGLGLTEEASIPDSFSLYDQVLDAAVAVGATPARFADLTGSELYFACARGDETRPALEMTKWFDTNYHYLVPEIDADTAIALSDTSVVDRFTEAKEAGYTVRPVLVGPLTLLALAKGSEADPDFDPLERLDDVAGVYEELLSALDEAGAPWVQLDEPALVTDNLPASRADLLDRATALYERLAGVEHRPQILLALPYGDSSTAQERLAATGVEALAVDLDRGQLADADFSGITIAAGVIDGRNVWRTDLASATELLDKVAATGARVVATTSTSLQHVPHTTKGEVWEAGHEEHLAGRLAFADEKIGEIATLARGLADSWDAIKSEIDEATSAIEAHARAEGVKVPEVRERLAALTEADRKRASGRRAAQEERLGLPKIPTTTIGSFPQTQEIRSARAAHARGDLSTEDYRARLREEIASVIKLQEDIGLDVLVHGEAERNDMVQYFAELLEGFAVTKNGWVQSYGSRCTRPSILWGDVRRRSNLGTEWITYAQSLTARPVKGMLTGPVTIIAWSFPRKDIPLPEVADQIALALRDEIDDLQEAGTAIIQVDEPALRELLPLEKTKHADYLDWSVGAFRLATSGAEPATQIHTHLCYSEFNQIIDALAALDADVTSIEAARSRMEVLPGIADSFTRQVGPGVWDIHSPRIPPTSELAELLTLALGSVPADRLWANPDCGLKTRGYEETEATLRNLVAAAAQVRASAE
ncbi:MAG: 5-methyltetrahydropteroyltriglutamate--homocysteine S-methyltransferase [Flaviflexus sp.]|nr:5-methyltetrahydropteroyltriglutamate--homocysteine S-methyltransferase [Flaviflexus sp.]